MTKTSIAIVNTFLPTAGEQISYLSGESLRDYDIVLFDPEFPYLERVDFTGGGSTITLEGGQRLREAISHWKEELRNALRAGKTVFFLLNSLENDSVATGVTSNKGARNYTTLAINNYQVFPAALTVRNAKGKHILVSGGAYKGLHEVLKEVAQYRVIIEPEEGTKIFVTKDGASIGAEARLTDMPGHIVLLPYFSLQEFNGEQRAWAKETLGLSQKIERQLIAISEMLTKGSDLTPTPEWVAEAPKPNKVRQIDDAIKVLDAEIATLQGRRNAEIGSRDELISFAHLLYETGKPLEDAIENALKLLGYSSESFRDGALEIDHVITGPEGFRMIGESEGKDNAAISITKFRQLESNINEDLQREEVAEPAKGVLFGNGFRLTAPEKRDEQFTEKCRMNAKRLGTALVRTSDLYSVVVRVLDNPDDEAFKKACREAIENTQGEIVKFP